MMCTVNLETSAPKVFRQLLMNLITIIIADGYFVMIITYHFRCWDFMYHDQIKDDEIGRAYSMNGGKVESI
jgi:hypothetical protein